MDSVQWGKTTLSIAKFELKPKFYADAKSRKMSPVKWFNGQATIFMDASVLEIPLQHMTGKITSRGMAFRLLDQLSEVTNFTNFVVSTENQIICPKINGKDTR